MKSKLLAILEGMGYETWLMHTMPLSKKYPDSFFTYMVIDAPFKAHYDNRPHAIVWGFWIGFYSSNPSLVESVPMELTKRLLDAGWSVPGAGEDVPSDEPTHTGWRLTAYYVQNLENEEA